MVRLYACWGGREHVQWQAAVGEGAQRPRRQAPVPNAGLGVGQHDDGPARRARRRPDSGSAARALDDSSDSAAQRCQLVVRPRHVWSRGSPRAARDAPVTRSSARHARHQHHHPAERCASAASAARPPDLQPRPLHLLGRRPRRPRSARSLEPETRMGRPLPGAGAGLLAGPVCAARATRACSGDAPRGGHARVGSPAGL